MEMDRYEYLQKLMKKLSAHEILNALVDELSNIEAIDYFDKICKSYNIKIRRQ